MLRVSRAEGDPGFITRFKVFRRSLTGNGFKSFQSRDFRAPRVKGFNTCRDIFLVYPQGIKGVQGSIFPKLTGFQGLNVSRGPKIHGIQGFKG